MDLFQELTAPSRAKARSKPRVSVERPAKGGSMLINVSMLPSAPKDAAEAIERLAALSRRVKVGKRLGATEVIKAERA